MIATATTTIKRLAEHALVDYTPYRGVELTEVGRAVAMAAIRDLELFSQRWPDAVSALITGHHPVDAARGLLLSPPAGIKEVIAFGGARA